MTRKQTPFGVNADIDATRAADWSLYYDWECDRSKRPKPLTVNIYGLADMMRLKCTSVESAVDKRKSPTVPTDETGDVVSKTRYGQGKRETEGKSWVTAGT
jgi:hypothetical protein